MNAARGETGPEHLVPSDFEPLSMSRWPLLMTITWIMTRSVDEVRRHMDGWRAANGAHSCCGRTVEALQHEPEMRVLVAVPGDVVFRAVDELGQGEAVQVDGLAPLADEATEG